MKYMKYVKILEEEMQEVLEQLKPHFEPYGELEIYENYIEFTLFNNNYGYPSVVTRVPIVQFKHHKIVNNYYNSCNFLPINIEDIFEEVGDNLKDLKIKKAQKFDIDKFKQELAEKHNLDTIPNLDNYQGDWYNFLDYNKSILRKFKEFRLVYVEMNVNSYVCPL